MEVLLRCWQSDSATTRRPRSSISFGGEARARCRGSFPDRLTNSLVLVDDPDTGKRSLGVQEKALSALESLLFAKYQMYRNVYWHHAVRSATAMYKRLVEDAVRADVVDVQSLARHTDEGLMHTLESERATPLLAAL